MHVLIQTGTCGKTALALKANVNYARFLKHLHWLEQKKLVELVVLDGKVNVKLTREGRQFAVTLSDKE
jgi:predicted transcriptional regulator